MNIEITTAARRILRAYREHAHGGGNLHCWADGATQWMTTGSYYENPGEGYVGHLICDSRDRRSLAAIQEWLDS